MTASCAAADFVGSASLVADTVTVAGEGKSAGAVYTPEAEMVPADALPLGMPFTLHVTFVLLVFVTVAENVCELPNRIDPFVGVMVTATDCGGGVMEPELPPPQPGNEAEPNKATRIQTSAGALRLRFACKFP